jgi:hypothetical protein
MEIPPDIGLHYGENLTILCSVRSAIRQQFSGSTLRCHMTDLCDAFTGHNKTEIFKQSLLVKFSVDSFSVCNDVSIAI